jgi:hypothetical protein
MTGAFEILTIDVGKKRIGVRLRPDAREAEDVREYSERADAAPPGGFGSLADKLRGALTPPGKPAASRNKP